MEEAEGEGWYDPGGDVTACGFSWGHSPRACLAFLTECQLYTKAQWTGGCWVLAEAGVIREECGKYNCFPSPG